MYLKIKHFRHFRQIINHPHDINSRLKCNTVLTEGKMKIQETYVNIRLIYVIGTFKFQCIFKKVYRIEWFIDIIKDPKIGHTINFRPIENRHYFHSEILCFLIRSRELANVLIYTSRWIIYLCLLSLIIMCDLKRVCTCKYLCI
jgi:hypothetical protein